MCFDVDAHPPELPAEFARPPIAGAAGAEHHRTTRSRSRPTARRPSPRWAARTGEPRTVAVGFCFGGTQAYLASTNAELGLDGVIAFYGALDGSRLGIPSPPDHVGEMRGPILGLFGGADPGIPPEQVRAFDAALAEAGVEHEIVVYPGAPHSSFDRSYAEHADACEDAWRRVLDALHGPKAAAAR